MKKVVSYFWKIGLVLVVAGLILATVALVLGGGDANSLNPNPLEGVEELQEQVYTEDIQSLEIELNAGSLVIEPGDVFSVRGTAAESTTVFQSVKDGKLTITEERDRSGTGLWKINGLFWNSPDSAGRADTELIITMPEGYELEAVDISLGAGDMRLHGLTVMKKLDIENGSGYAELIQYRGTGETMLECGAGEILVAGTVEGEIDLECGAGQITLEVDGLEREYSYSVECGIGEVQIGDQGYSNLGAEAKVIVPNARGEFDIECGVGQVIVLFEANRVE